MFIISPQPITATLIPRAFGGFGAACSSVMCQFTRKVYNSRVNPIAVYVHIPFCPSKCGYCDFNSYAMEGEIMERTTRAIIAEIERSEQRGRPAKSLFFGGGTPTFLSAAQLLRILDAVVCAHPP